MFNPGYGHYLIVSMIKVYLLQTTRFPLQTLLIRLGERETLQKHYISEMLFIIVHRSFKIFKYMYTLILRLYIDLWSNGPDAYC